jgi:hypothetical protein
MPRPTGYPATVPLGITTRRGGLAAAGLLLILLAILADLNTSCDCNDVASCFDISRVPCKVGLVSGLLGEPAGRAAASDAAGIALVISGVVLFILTLTTRREV